MLDINTAIKTVLQGWSPKREIELRAFAIKGHLQHGSDRRAEEYAVEIERLQMAEDERSGIASPWINGAVNMSLADWSNAIILGGFRVYRRASGAAQSAFAIAAE